MLKIWGRTNSVNVQKVLWCLAELDVPYERVDAGLQHGKNDEAWYLALNPNGRVPLLQDGDFSLWESNTIVRYLAAKHGMGSLCPKSLETRAQAEKWMDWQLSVLVQPVSTVFWNLIRTPAGGPDMQFVARATRDANHAVALLDGHLAKHDFVAGSELSMGDIPVGATVHRWLELPGVERPKLPAIEAWHARLTERPGFRRHVMLPLS
jgi:glutathione S-transferase